MELSDRKKKILSAVVENYIETAEPVGSKAIADGSGFSSATIRNEMSDLTAKGYLEQPHTSAGRIPSTKGYRLYVDELMHTYKLSLEETDKLNQALRLKMQELDRVISEAARVISRLTNYPGLSSRSMAMVTIRRFELLKMDRASFIAVIVTSNDTVKNKLIKLPVEIEEQDIRLLTAVLNASFTGLTTSQITPELLRSAEQSAGQAGLLIPLIISYAIEVLEEYEKQEFYLSGETSLLTQPEYKDVDKVRQLMETLGSENILSRLPSPDSDDQVKILIGPENVALELHDTSVIVAKYNIGDGMEGLIGVVGPTRMDYAKVAARLSYFAEGLNRIFNSDGNILEDNKKK